MNLDSRTGVMIARVLALLVVLVLVAAVVYGLIKFGTLIRIVGEQD